MVFTPKANIEDEINPFLLCEGEKSSFLCYHACTHSTTLQLQKRTAVLKGKRSNSEGSRMWNMGDSQSTRQGWKFSTGCCQLTPEPQSITARSINTNKVINTSTHANTWLHTCEQMLYKDRRMYAVMSPQLLYTFVRADVEQCKSVWSLSHLHATRQALVTFPTSSPGGAIQTDQTYQAADKLFTAAHFLFLYMWGGGGGVTTVTGSGEVRLDVCVHVEIQFL